MATKRALTGGTGDVNPQYLLATVTGTGGDGFAAVKISIPIFRGQGNSQRKVTVMELLKTTWDFSSLSNNESNMTATLMTSFMNDPDASGTSIVDRQSISVKSSSTDGTIPVGAYTLSSQPFFHDLTDGAGHGILVATDAMWLGLSSSNLGFSATCTLRLMYRWKEVGLEEYIGIVQSQTISNA